MDDHEDFTLNKERRRRHSGRLLLLVISGLSGIVLARFWQRFGADIWGSP